MHIICTARRFHFDRALQCSRRKEMVLRYIDFICFHCICISGTLHSHLQSHGVDYLQFSFRWMNNLLTRELPLHSTIRLWDTYLAESDGFAVFQLYVCAAFLLHWRDQLLQENDFQVSFVNQFSNLTGATNFPILVCVFFSPHRALCCYCKICPRITGLILTFVFWLPKPFA